MKFGHGQYFLYSIMPQKHDLQIEPLKYFESFLFLDNDQCDKFDFHQMIDEVDDSTPELMQNLFRMVFQ